MGNSVDVRWSLGPSVKAVEAIADKYRSGSFNGMEDIYEYDRSDFGDAVENRPRAFEIRFVRAFRLLGTQEKLAPAVCEFYGKPCVQGFGFIHLRKRVLRLKLAAALVVRNCGPIILSRQASRWTM